MKQLLCAAALALGLSAPDLAAGGPAASPFPSPPTPGVRAYVYQVVEAANGKTRQGYRTGFDLETSPDGAIDAVVRTAEETADGEIWRPVEASEACKAAMHAPVGAVARVRLWPITEDVARTLGPTFLDTCAPGGVFYPLTDILNVVIIPLSPRFEVAALHRQGDRAHYDGFTARFDRAGQNFEETSHGGEVSLPVLSGGKAVVDWAPAPADLAIGQTVNGQPIQLTGTEHWAFRVTLDAATGALMDAHTDYDDLDLVARLPDVSAGIPQKISRTVTITPR